MKFQLAETLEQALGAAFSRLNYTTHIDDMRQIVYVETPKVACTSIKKFMMDQYVGGEFLLENKNLVHRRDLSPLKQLSELYPAAVKKVWSDQFRKFSFIRNPYTRCLSGYLDKIVTNEYERERHLPSLGFDVADRPSLLEFLERLAIEPDKNRDIHFMTQSGLLMIDKVAYAYLGRFECFAQDFQTLQSDLYGLKAAGETYEGFGKHHASDANKKTEAYFGEREAELVYQIYKVDFDVFGYSREVSDANLVIEPIETADVAGRYKSLKLPTEKLDDEPFLIAEKIMNWNLKSGISGSGRKFSNFVKGKLERKLQSYLTEERYDAVLNIYACVPSLIEGNLISSVQVAKSLIALRRLEDAAKLLETLRAQFPQAPMVWILSVETQLNLQNFQNAVQLFEQFASVPFIHQWARRKFTSLLLRCVHSDPTLVERLAERVFLEDSFLGGSDDTWFPASDFMTELQAFTPENPEVLRYLRRGLSSSGIENTKRAAVTRFIIQGKDFSLHGDTLELLKSALTSMDRETFVMTIGSKLFKSRGVVLLPDEHALLKSVAEELNQQGRNILSIALSVFIGQNVSQQLTGEYRVLGKKNRPLPNDRRPKLALCISGQLRGFRSTYPYWPNCGLFDAADVSVFVSTWEKIGRKQPIPPHADRTFSGAFLAAYRQFWKEAGGYQAIVATYPDFSGLLDVSASVSHAELEDVYGTKDIEIFDETNSQFNGYTDQQKMYFQIGNAHRMASEFDKNFDLALRVRPDFKPYLETAGEWKTVLNDVYNQGIIYADQSYKIFNPMGLFVGDQMALGQFATMSHYASIDKELNQEPPGRIVSLDNGPKAHSSLAFHLASEGLTVKPLPGARFVDLVDPSRLPAHQIAEALAKDISEENRSTDPLWQAIQKDLKTGQG